METIATTTTIKTPEVESEALTRIHQAKPLSFSKDVLNHHHHHHHNPPHHHHHHLHGFTTKNHHHATVVTYKECLKNHAASMGGHSVDGCGEFMPSPNTNPSDPTSLRCAACGCHRNFHRREPEEPFPPPNTTPLLEYQPHHRHHPPPPPPPQNTNTLSQNSPPSSPSPPPISSSYYKLLPLPLSTPSSETNTCNPFSPGSSTNPSSRKRFRTKFTQEQKEKMLEFAERIEWKIQNQDKEMINGFCNEIGVERGVLKVWMHNNKNTLGKKDQNSSNMAITTIPTSTSTPNNINGSGVAASWMEES